MSVGKTSVENMSVGKTSVENMSRCPLNRVRDQLYFVCGQADNGITYDVVVIIVRLDTYFMFYNQQYTFRPKKLSVP